MAILGKLNTISGYVNDLKLIMGNRISAGLTSVQMYGSTEDTPRNFQWI